MLKEAKRWRERAEAILGTAAVFMIGFAPTILGVLFGLAALVNRENAEWLPAWVCFPVAVVSGALAVWVARLIQRALYMCHPELRKLDQVLTRGQKSLMTPFETDQPVETVHLPMAVVAGTSLPRVPVLAAIPLALWWLAHASTGVIVGLRLDRYMDQAFRGAPAGVKYVLPQVLNFAFSFAANIYLMLAVALFVRNTTWLLRLWKVRLFIDLVLTAITAIPALLQWLEVWRH